MIQEQNIKFLESQVMDDIDNGGGAATSTEIVDGRMNNVFEDVSDLDRAYGRFNLRKLFLAVRTLSTDLYGGAKTCITALPEDPAISYTMFSRGDQFDRRSDAANAVESYLHKSLGWHGLMFGNHLQNMKTLTLVQRIGTRLPPIGKTLCIVQNEGLSTEIEQYVRVIDLDVEERTFDYFDNSGNLRTFTRWVVTHTLSDPLRFDFEGHEPGPTMAADFSTRAMVRDTYVVDAAVYYSSRRTQAAAAMGDDRIRVDSIYNQLVPSAETETPLMNQPINPSVSVIISAGTRTVEVPQQAHTHQIAVTAENRRNTWVETLSPIPAPGTLTVSYMAQGNWYELRDDGAGGIVGDDPVLGAGTIDYSTGAMYVTLGVLPDADTSIIEIWASPVHYFKRAGDTSDADDALEYAFSLENTPVYPTTLTLEFLVAGETVTATDSAGEITGPGVTGSINYATGDVLLRFTQPPDRNTVMQVAYDIDDGKRNDAASATITSSKFQMPGTGPWQSQGGGVLHYTLPRTVISLPFRITPGGAVVIRGGLLQLGSPTTTYRWPSATVGTFDSQTGEVTITQQLGFQQNTWNTIGKSWSLTTLQRSPSSATDLVAVSSGSPSPQARSEQRTIGALTLRLLTTTADIPVPNSLEFRATGKTYRDNNGELYADIDPQTGSGTPSGSVDYTSGIATITWWSDNQPGAISVDSLLVQYGEWTATSGFFRTAASPLKPEALQLICTTQDGQQIMSTADENGHFNHAIISGTVNSSQGIGAVEFAEPVMPSTVRYNAVAYSYLPLDADILGIESVRLPSDGRVPVFRNGNVILIMHHAETEPQTVTSGGTISCGRTRISWVRITDANGEPVRDNYELDRENGIVTITDATGIAMPVKVRHTVSDLRVATDVQITGYITLSRPLSHDFPAEESLVASCLIQGDRRARVLDVWDQASWNGTWSDLHGTQASATLNLIDHPITVTNEGCDTDRWALRWLTTTTVELISERRGLIWSGSYTAGGADIAPINPRTREWDEQLQEWVGGTPYMVIPGAANGGGWSAGNVLRINTEGAISDIWIARAINQSDEPMDDGEDGCEIYALGNIDRP